YSVTRLPLLEKLSTRAFHHFSGELDHFSNLTKLHCVVVSHPLCHRDRDRYVSGRSTFIVVVSNGRIEAKAEQVDPPRFPRRIRVYPPQQPRRVIPQTVVIKPRRISFLA